LSDAMIPRFARGELLLRVNLRILLRDFQLHGRPSD
jgi:hypothetical protein